VMALALEALRLIREAKPRDITGWGPNLYEHDLVQSGVMWGNVAIIDTSLQL